MGKDILSGYCLLNYVIGVKYPWLLSFLHCSLILACWTDPNTAHRTLSNENKTGIETVSSDWMGTKIQREKYVIKWSSWKHIKFNNIPLNIFSSHRQSTWATGKQQNHTKKMFAVVSTLLCISVSLGTMLHGATVSRMGSCCSVWFCCLTLCDPVD